MNNQYLSMSIADIELIQEARSWRTMDSSSAIRLQEWLRRNFDPAANYCSTCSDSVRALYTRCMSLWEMHSKEIIAEHNKFKRRKKS